MKLSDSELTSKLKNLAGKERELLHEILLVIKEIDSRKIFLGFGFANLFEYLVREIGYSEGSAQRRIDAARLMKDVPELGAKICNGEITLNQVSMVQKAIRQIQKDSSIAVSKKSIPKEHKLDVLCSIAGKGHAESQNLVAQFFDLPVVIQLKQNVQADNSVRLELTLSEEQFSKLEKAKELLSHAVPSGDMAQLLEYLADRVIAQKTKAIGSKSKISNNQIENPIRNSPKPTAIVAAKIRREVFASQSCCQYVDPTNKRPCGSRWQLQIDHIRPRWAGGDNSIKNLRVLCGPHNRLLYSKQSGVRKI